jgi:hypothetical protein
MEAPVPPQPQFPKGFVPIPAAAQPASPPSYDCEGEPPSLSGPFDAELHTMCDEDMQAIFQSSRKIQDPRMVEYGKAREKDWNCWKAFPSRWQMCRTLGKLK